MDVMMYRICPHSTGLCPLSGLLPKKSNAMFKIWTPNFIIRDQDSTTKPCITTWFPVKPDHMISDTRLQWLGLDRKVRSQTLKQALYFTQRAIINFFKPLCKQIDYQTLTCGSHPALFMKTRPIAISCVLQAFSDRQTNRPTNWPTNRVAYRVACMQLKSHVMVRIWNLDLTICRLRLYQ